MQLEPLTGKEVPSLNARAVCKHEADSNGQGCFFEPKQPSFTNGGGGPFGPELKGTQR